MPNAPAEELIRAAGELSAAVDRLSFADPVTHVYNPLAYAWSAHRDYLARVGRNVSVLFLGMNPGPWGMAQTGVPFGEIAAVRDWLGIEANVGRPKREHAKRPVQGFACERSEVSGRRLWGLFRERFQTPKRFFAEHFVANYCPLVFMEQTARNRTPDKLPAAERRELTAVCDRHLADVIETLAPNHLVGIGVYAESCLKRVAERGNCPAAVTRILHPSPASPAANRDWEGTVTAQLQAAGIW